ncbi:MAG: hypothetical protein IT372_42525 [Polyangiaceae bacterium]|nr:hypothetical protein [Polyangiaceae bacterium]
MTATTNRVPRNTRTADKAIPSAWKFDMPASVEAKKGWLMAYRLADGLAVPFTEATNLGSAGVAQSDQAAGTVDGAVGVICDGMLEDFDMSTAGGDSFTNADIPAIAYGVSNHEVGKLSTGRSIAGIFFGLNPDTGKARCFVGPAAFTMAKAMQTAALLAATSSGTGASLVGVEDLAARFAGAHVEAVLAELGARFGAPVADAAALQAVPAATRAQGQIVLKLDDHSLWRFDSGSTASAGDSVIVPTAGTGRWLLIVRRRQTGTATLAAGTVTVSGVELTASSRIQLTMKDPGAGAITSFAALHAPDADRNVGAGTFVVNAIDDAKATIATAVCTFDWEVIG